MKIANKIEVNTLLVLILVISGLLFIDLFVVPYYINDYYLANFRVLLDENTIGSLIKLSKQYENPKIYFVGDSVFWGNGLSKLDTMPQKFEECDKKNRKSFNLALKGSRLQDEINTIKLLDNNTIIIMELNPLGMIPGQVHPTVFNSNSTLNKTFNNFPNLYNNRYIIQEYFFETVSTKRYLLNLYMNRNKPKPDIVPHYNAPSIIINQTFTNNELSVLQNNVYLFLIPIYNKTYNYSIDSTNVIDLSNESLEKKYYLDYQHFSKEGTEYLAKKLCEAI